ncbi:hypothetical protein RJ640_008863 [Escallonia rubra]|uniref:RRM domain-containing protein n=1 Tax=Escallonia rubra TaxID=112253 RepID=A0AA88QFH3_9ASTE|nr:hypothetical protein RJ640_008863 [Escallonia rubra]
MAESAEVEDRVDFDDDNYIEMDDDVDEHTEDEGVGGGGSENGEEQQEELRIEDTGEEQLRDEDRSDIAVEPVEGEAKTTAFVDDDEKEKRAEILALPPHGSEVFIGALPREVTEEDLRDLCEPIGEIFETRLMKNRDTGESKGFAFVAFKAKDVAQKAIEKLHNTDFKGRTLRCSLSETKYRLFIGNVPKVWTDDEFRKVIDETGPGAENVELIKDPQNPGRNRGFAFVEYYNNACADYSRQKMSSANFKLDGNTPTVTWADPKSTPDHSAAAQVEFQRLATVFVAVIHLGYIPGADSRGIRALTCHVVPAVNVKALYVKNIPENTPSEQLKELFQRHGEVTKVVMPPAKSGGKRDFGFVHFAERSSALKAIKDSEKYEVNVAVVGLVLGNISLVVMGGCASGGSSYVGVGYGGPVVVVALEPTQGLLLEATAQNSPKKSMKVTGDPMPCLFVPEEEGTQDTSISARETLTPQTSLRPLQGQLLEVVLAKPQSDKRSDGANSINAPAPNYMQHPGYGGFPGNPYVPVGPGYGVTSGFQQPMIYGRGPMPTGMQMVPMVLPDGRIGYVLQQPGVQMPPMRPQRNDRNSGTGGPQGRGGTSGGSDGAANRGRRYRPY